MEKNTCSEKGCPNYGRYCRFHAKLTSHLSASKIKEVKSYPVLLEETQKAVNKYVRLRDKDKTCMCCKKRVTDAGHLYPKSVYTGVRFDLVNLNGQNNACNCFKDAKAIDPDFYKGAVKRYGEAEIAALHERAIRTRVYTFTTEQLYEIQAHVETLTNALKQNKAA